MKPIRIFSHWEQVRFDLLATLDGFKEAELAYQPFKNSWSVGQIALHIADCADNWLHGVVRGEITPWVFYDFQDHPTRGEIKKILELSYRKTCSFLESLEENDLDVLYTTPHGEKFSLYWIIWHVLEHEIHHRGELSLIHGLLGREGLDV